MSRPLTPSDLDVLVNVAVDTWVAATNTDVGDYAHMQWTVEQIVAGACTAEQMNGDDWRAVFYAVTARARRLSTTDPGDDCPGCLMCA